MTPFNWLSSLIAAVKKAFGLGSPAAASVAAIQPAPVAPPVPLATAQAQAAAAMAGAEAVIAAHPVPVVTIPTVAPIPTPPAPPLAPEVAIIIPEGMDITTLKLPSGTLVKQGGVVSRVP